MGTSPIVAKTHHFPAHSHMVCFAPLHTPYRNLTNCPTVLTAAMHLDDALGHCIIPFSDWDETPRASCRTESNLPQSLFFCSYAAAAFATVTFQNMLQMSQVLAAMPKPSNVGWTFMSVAWPLLGHECPSYRNRSWPQCAKLLRQCAATLILHDVGPRNGDLQSIGRRRVAKPRCLARANKQCLCFRH